MIYFLSLIFLLTTVVIDPTVYLPYYTPKIYFFILAVGLLLAAFLLLNYLVKKRQGFKFSIIEVLLFALIIWRIITNIFILQNELQILWMLSLVIIPVIIMQLENDERRKFLEILLMTLYMAGFIQALFGFYQFFSAPAYLPKTIKTPIIGFVGAPNGFGSLLAVSIIAVVADFLNRKNKYVKYFLIVIFIVNLFALVINGSRGAMLALFISFIVYSFFYIYFVKVSYFFNFIKKYRFVLFSLVSGIIILFFIFLYSLNIESSTGRVMIWRISMPMFTENPLTGIGFGNYAVKYLSYQSKFFSNPENLYRAYKAVNLKQAHNEYLQILCETGLLGFVIFLILIFFVIWAMYRKLKNSTDKKEIIQESGILAIFIFILLHGFVDDSLHFVPTAILFFIIIGLAQTNIKNIFSKRSFRLPAIISLFLILFLYTFLGLRFFDQYRGFKSWAKGQSLVRKNQIVLALPHLKEANKKLPDNGELQFHLGSALALNKNYSKGLYYLEKSLSSFSDRNIYLSMSYASMKLYDLKKAEKYASIALSMFPDHLAPHLLLGQIYFKMNEFDKSKYALRKCINLKTKVLSSEVLNIKRDAQKLWVRYRYKN